MYDARALHSADEPCRSHTVGHACPRHTRVTAPVIQGTAAKRYSRCHPRFVTSEGTSSSFSSTVSAKPPDVLDLQLKGQSLFTKCLSASKSSGVGRQGKSIDFLPNPPPLCCMIFPQMLIKPSLCSGFFPCQTGNNRTFLVKPNTVAQAL